MNSRFMYSRFPGQCVACRESFPAGEPIQWSKETGARHHCCPSSRPENQVAPCWDCGQPGKFRNFGASSPVYCDACCAAHKSREKAALAVAIDEDEAWALAEEEGKAPPYKGGALQLRNGRLLSHFAEGYFLSAPAESCAV